MLGRRLAFGPFVLNPEAGTLLRKGVPIPVPYRASLLLTAFLNRPGEVLTKSDLIDAAWQGAAVGYLIFPAHEVKNAHDLEYPLSPRTLGLLDLYLKTYRPLLLKGEQSSKLFVSWSGRQKTPAELAAQIPKFIRTRLGLDVNLHLFRHLAGYVFLTAHPGEYETVRQLLGHKSLKTTIDFYTGLEHAQSFRRYDEILERHREGTLADA